MQKELQLMWESYKGQWEVNPLSVVDIKDGLYKAYQSGYELNIEGHIFKLDSGIRGKNFPFNCEIKNGKILLSYT